MLLAAFQRAFKDSKTTQLKFILAKFRLNSSMSARERDQAKIKELLDLLKEFEKQLKDTYDK